MAKKKKKKSSKRRSGRGRIGAIDFNTPLMVIGGAVASELLDKVLGTSIDTKLKEGGKIAVGIFAPMLVKDAKTKQMLTNVGAGLAAQGAINLAKEFGLLSGVPDQPDDVEELAVILEGDKISENVLGGDVPVINEEVLGRFDMDVVNGFDEQLM